MSYGVYRLFLLYIALSWSKIKEKTTTKKDIHRHSIFLSPVKSETGKLSRCILYSSGYRKIEQYGAKKIVGRCGGWNHNWIQVVAIKEGRRERYEHTKAEVGIEVPLLCASFQTTVAGGLYWLQQKNQLMTITFYFYRQKYFIGSVLLCPRALWASDNSLSIPKRAFSSFSSPWELCRKVTCINTYING